MKEPPHLTDEQVDRYRNRNLAPAALLEIDRHLSVCEPCRDRLYASVGATSRIASLRADLSGHLDYAGVVACAARSASPEQEEHLGICADCRGEVEDLRAFQQELRETPRAPLVMPVRPAAKWRVPLTIAAGLAVVGVTLWTLRSSNPQPTPVASVPSAVSAEAPLTPSERQTLELAQAGGKLERAPVLDRLVTRRGTLLGPGGDARRFDLTGPMGTVVTTDRPVFHWNALPGAVSYKVAIFDENFDSVATSPAVTGTEWQPEQPLPRGRVLNWQVSAQVGGETVHSPAPPAPEARFSVMPADMAAEIEAARRDHPANHLLLAAMYAKAGDVEEARRELDAMDPAVAAPYRESLKQMR